LKNQWKKFEKWKYFKKITVWRLGFWGKWQNEHPFKGFKSLKGFDGKFLKKRLDFYFDNDYIVK